MWKTLLISFALSLPGLAQTSSDGSFSVHHLKRANFSLKPEQMRDAENIYRNACVVVQRDFLSAACELHLRFTVVIGAERDEVLARRTTQADELWMKKWDPNVSAQGVVLLAVEQSLTPDVVQ
ncbi:MAG TPA: hypothetical protein VIX37_06840, partial [Candidatus Sulfotelmatobacter sp.]